MATEELGMTKNIPERPAPFDMQDDIEFRIALNTAIMDVLPSDPFLSPMHARVSALTHHERLFLALDIFDSETYNEGISHFFFYDCGDLYEYVVEGLTAIGLTELATELQKYVTGLFGANYPLETTARQEILLATEELEEVAGDAFERYYDTSIRLSECLVAWARANRTHFRMNNVQAC